MSSAPQPPSTVAPSDSASTASKRSKPGKRERAARRGLTGSTPGQNASADKASLFAAGSSGPTPQPGRFPIVFQTGAGEPTRDEDFILDLTSLTDVLKAFSSNYAKSPRFVEFRAHAGTTDVEFRKATAVSFLLRLAQQLVHSHVNMGLPQGDFAPIASSDVRVLGAISAAVNQYGEFQVPSLGTRYLWADYENTVSRLVFCADQINAGRPVDRVIERMWLPMSRDDGYTKLFIANALNEWLETNLELSVKVDVLRDAILSGTVPDAWKLIKPALGDEPEEGERDLRDRFDFLFLAPGSAANLVTTWTNADNFGVLEELDLEWNDPLADHLNWSYQTKVEFSRLANSWARISAAYAQFFEMSSGAAARSAACGTQAQMVDVSTSEGITVVKSAVALSAPEFSLASCFPPECIFASGIHRRVVVVTSANVLQRATEFCQLDWR